MVKRFKTFITEARRNPEQNPKIPALAALRKYINDPNIYISFTQDMEQGFRDAGDPKVARTNNERGSYKIGINPKSVYNTPLGIYTLPLEVAWEYYGLGDENATVKSNIEIFCSESPYIYVLRLKDPKGFVRNMGRDYTSADYDRDIEKLHQIYADSYKAEYDVQLNRFSSHSLIDDEQLESWTNSFNKTVDKRWNKMVEDGIDTAKARNPIMCFWNISRSLAGLLASKTSGKRSTANRSAVKWNWIFRKCGYTGFGDESARGYIHESEPLQAVFFSMAPLEVVEVIDNKEYDSNKKLINSVGQINTYLDNLPSYKGKLGATFDFIQYIVSKIGNYKHKLSGKIAITASPEKLVQSMSYTNALRFVGLVGDAAQEYDLTGELGMLKVMIDKYSTMSDVHKQEILSDIDRLFD